MWQAFAGVPWASHYLTSQAPSDHVSHTYRLRFYRWLNFKVFSFSFLCTWKKNTSLTTPLVLPNVCNFRKMQHIVIALHLCDALLVIWMLNTVYFDSFGGIKHNWEILVECLCRLLNAKNNFLPSLGKLPKCCCTCVATLVKLFHYESRDSSAKDVIIVFLVWIQPHQMISKSDY